MNLSHRRLARRALSGALACVLGVSVMAMQSQAQPQPAGNTPPSTYQLKDVAISVTRHTAGSPAPLQRLHVVGAGTSSYEHQNRTTTSHYAGRDVLTLLKSLYAMRFFELPDDYTSSSSPSLLDDGTIRVGRLRMADAQRTSVCVNIASYEKCVTYAHEHPSDLETFVKTALRQADELRREK